MTKTLSLSIVTASIFINMSAPVAFGFTKSHDEFSYSPLVVCDTQSEYKKMIKWSNRRGTLYERELIDLMGKKKMGLKQAQAQLRRTFKYPKPNFKCTTFSPKTVIVEKSGLFGGWTCMRDPKWAKCKWKPKPRGL